MRFLKKLVLCVFALLVLVVSRAENVLFTHYTVDDGLSSNSVSAVCQDSAGFLWMATRCGVSRFDGVNFQKFNSNTDSAIQRNDLYHVFLLPNGKPTFSSNNSVLVSYDANTASFVNISGFLPENKYKYNVGGFAVQQNGEGILATANGLYRYVPSSDSFQKVDCAYDNFVLDVCTDKFGRKWVGNFNGCFILDRNGDYIPGGIFKSDEVNIVHRVNDDYMLLCSYSGPVWLAQVTDEASVPVFNKLDAPFSYVTAVAVDKHGIFWMGTLNDGLWKCRFSGGRFSYDKVNPLNEPNDALTKISDIFIDRNDDIWVSTQGAGVWRTTPIGAYSYIKSKDVGFPIVVGASFCTAANGDVLMGTDGMGMYLFSEKLQLKRSVPHLSSNSVLTIVPDGPDFLVGFWGGATNHLNLKTGGVSKVVYNGISNPHFTTKNICRTADGTLYVSVAGDGIYRGSAGRWERLVMADSSMADYPDLWFEGTMQKPDGTVRCYSSRSIWSNLSGKFKPILPDADKSRVTNPLHVNHCVANADNVLFAATNKGIYMFDKDDAFLGVMDFVPAGYYSSLIIDSLGCLWASGDCGILAIDVKNRQYETVVPEGALPSADYFTGRACLISQSGNLFFGCKDGFVCVQPHVRAHTQNCFLAFSQLTIHGEKVPVGDEVLPRPLNQLSELALSYGQNHFSLGFDLVDLALVNHMVPKFRIPQVDSDWVELGDKRTIDIPFLPAGNYTVELAAFAGNQPAKVVSLAVRVSPPWWKSVWFGCLVLLSLAVMFYLFYRARMRRQLQFRCELQQMVDERTRDLNEANLLLEEQKEAIQATNLSLLDTLKQKDQLVSVVAHDLKNPMFAIVSTLKRLVESVYTSAQQQRILAKLADESEGLQNQMVSLLQWATGKDSDAACHQDAVDTNILVADALSLLDGLAREKNIELCRVGELRFMTWADSRMLSTIVRNLVTNAVKFSPKGSKVTVSLAETEQLSLIKVQDTGVGMPPEKIEQLLKGANVVSTSGTESEAGFGFGFKIVLDYVRKNQGAIDIQSLPGQGTTVTVSLPRCAEETVEPVLNNEPKVELSINKDLLSGKRILVVDDDELILEHITALLTPYVEVLQAHDGQEGLAVAKAQVPDLIISDVDMPKMNGIQMYEELMNHLLTNNIPLLFLSAKTDDTVRFKGLSIGAIDYIAKPFEDNELLVKICNFLLWQQRMQVKALTQTYKGDEAEQVDTVNPLLQKIINLVKENYANPLFSLADVVQQLGMSKATLSRRLKSISDKTPMEILTEYRLNMAKKLLENGDMTVSDVAYAVGFNDPSYFSRRFKEVFGTSPKAVK